MRTGSPIGRTVFTACLMVAAGAAAGYGQTPAGKAPESVMAANKQMVLDFFDFRGAREDRAEKFMAPDYIQHNARFLRMDETDGAHGNHAWVQAQIEATRRGGIRLVDLPGIALRDPIILTAEGELGHAVYRGTRPDPDVPGQTYEVFAFEAFRFRNGQFAEHWDQVPLTPGWSTPPAPQPGGGRGVRPATSTRPEPAAGCSESAESLAKDKRLATSFLDTAITPKNAAKNAKELAEQYVEHDPRFVAFDRKEKLSGRAGFVRAVEAGLNPRPAPVTTPVSERTRQMLIGECGYVSAVWKQVLNDPDMPGRTWEAFTFDTFRLDHGAIAEHWNGASR